MGGDDQVQNPSLGEHKKIPRSMEMRNEGV